MPKDPTIQSVLVIGSGPIVIGQAAEFDYAGTQACMTLKDEGIRVILINNNPATIMTDEIYSDAVYFEPLTVKAIEKVIEKERPDGLLASLGGQTGLNLAVQLHQKGILEKYHVKLLGTTIDTIIKGEDREAFRELMFELEEPVPESAIVQNIEEAVTFSKRVGFPIIIRPAYTLGGSGGGIAHSLEEFMQKVNVGLNASPIHQCLIEMSIAGYKEIEYEMMRDKNDTCIAICNMENVDPVGVHTGDSIVVAPTLTLTHEENEMFHHASVKIIRALGVIGGCNIQFALDPKSKRYYLIEVNPRVSRSSALASKATGYPIAKITTKLALGYQLEEIVNPITGYTYASVEPTIDYAVVKFPRFALDKFQDADRTLGTQMKATGEVMAIGQNLETAFQKAIRSLELKTEGFDLIELKNKPNEKLWSMVKEASDTRFFAIIELLRRGVTPENIHHVTKINLYFLHTWAHLIQLEQEVKKHSFSSLKKEELARFKQYGFTDKQLAKEWGVPPEKVKEKRDAFDLLPVYHMVDTCAGEFSANTPYFYSSWSGTCEVTTDEKTKKVIVLGSGPIRIGQGIEFDYCSVQGMFALKKAGYETIMINNNPETVSTDYMVSDRLYFEPLTLEDVMNIIEIEKPEGVIVQFGGQTAIALAKGLENKGVRILGMKSATIDQMEDRDLFYQFLNQLDIPHVKGVTAFDEMDAIRKAKRMGYPVLLRPSFVIGGQGMVVLHDEQQLIHYFNRYVNHDFFPILIDAYYPGKEVEVDCITDGADIYLPAIIEHIERAGVHSGDSMAIIPAQSLSSDEEKTIYDYTKKIATHMDYKGIFNIQFIMYEGRVFVLEINPRASRTVPVLSKVTGKPLIQMAVSCMLNECLKHKESVKLPMITVKAPIFSTTKLKGLDPLLGPEMKSTGEIIAISHSKEEAFRKVFDWHEEHKLPLYQSKGEWFIDCTEWNEEYLMMARYLKEHGYTLVSDGVCQDQTIETIESYSKWIQKKSALGILSLSGSSKQGMNRRMEALEQRKMVFTEWSTLQAALEGERVTKTTVHSIEYWLKQNQKEVVKQ